MSYLHSIHHSNFWATDRVITKKTHPEAGRTFPRGAETEA